MGLVRDMCAAGEMLQENAITLVRALLRGCEAQAKAPQGAGLLWNSQCQIYQARLPSNFRLPA